MNDSIPVSLGRETAKISKENREGLAAEHGGIRAILIRQFRSAAILSPRRGFASQGAGTPYIPARLSYWGLLLKVAESTLRRIRRPRREDLTPRAKKIARLIRWGYLLHMVVSIDGRGGRTLSVLYGTFEVVCLGTVRL